MGGERTEQATGVDELVQIDVELPGAPEAERAAAEAWECGIRGLEELPGMVGGVVLRLYAPPGKAEAVRAALAQALGPRGRVGPAEPLPPTDWATAWRQGLAAVQASPRVVVRPPFAAWEGPAVPCELVVEPGQAFGTGHHASTCLALQLLDEALAARQEGPGPALLDVGTGSGVLAMAGAALGARRAVGLDTDAVAVREARRNAVRNALADRVQVLAGPLEALDDTRPRFDLVVANLLRREVTPLLPAIARSVRPGGEVLLSGLLEEDRAQIEPELARLGLEAAAERRRVDRNECWMGLALRRGGHS